MNEPQFCCSSFSEATNCSGVSNTGNGACCPSLADRAGVFKVLASYRAVYTKLNAKLLAQARSLGEVRYLTPAEADATRITNERQAGWPWNLWKQLAQKARG